MKHTYYTTVTSGRLSQGWQNAVDSFEGQRVEVTIQKAKKKRSNPQNAYFHGVVLPLVANGLTDLGQFTSPAQAKEVIKLLFLQYEDAIGVPRTKNTSGLSTLEFNELIEQVQIWAADFLSVKIPDPNEQLKIEI